MNARSRRPILRGNSVLQMVAVLAIVVFANVLGSRWFSRFDMTSDQVYTLSHEGKVLMSRLEQPLIVRVYFTQGLEAPYNNHEQTLVDKLEEFRAWSRGRMELVVVDPTGDEELMAEAARLGIEPIPYTFRSESRTELKQVYMGAAFLYGDRQTVLPAITSVATIEYDIARTIKALLDFGQTRTMGFVVGHGEPDVLAGKGPVAQLRGALQANYAVENVDLSNPEGIGEHIDALVMVGPKEALPLEEQLALDQFVMSGRPAAFFLQNFRFDPRPPRHNAIPVKHGLEPLLATWNVELNRDVVVDRQNNGKMQFPVQQGSFRGTVPLNVPFIPTTTDLAQDSIVVKDLDTMTFPFVSSIDVPAELPAGVQIEVMARSEPGSGRIKAPKLFAPQVYQRLDPSEETGAWPLMVSVSGPLRSAFAGQELPDGLVVQIPEAERARIVVGGSADFIANNIAFMSNLADWMLEDEGLIAIRSKNVQVPVLEATTKAQRTRLKLINLLGPALLLLVFGGVKRLRRGAGGGPQRKAAEGEAA